MSEQQKKLISALGVYYLRKGRVLTNLEHYLEQGFPSEIIAKYYHKIEIYNKVETRLIERLCKEK